MNITTHNDYSTVKLDFLLCKHFCRSYDLFLLILGHYSTYCLMSDPPSPKRWMYFSDEQVRAVREEDVLKSQAYMLFYERTAAGPK